MAKITMKSSVKIHRSGLTFGNAAILAPVKDLSVSVSSAETLQMSTLIRASCEMLTQQI